MKFNFGIIVLVWFMIIGVGSGYLEISLIVFFVFDCKDIFIIGWGGNVNIGNSQYVQYSSIDGFFFIGNVYQFIINGSNFWLGVLLEDVGFLKYVMFMGGIIIVFYYVDGGISWFDKCGNVYYVVCGVCGGVDNGFIIILGVWL